MAGARDIKRARALALKEQAERNRQVTEERERRRSEMSAARAPSQRRRSLTIGRAQADQFAREGRKMVHTGIDNKMDTGEDNEDKDTLKGVSFASPQALALAQENNLTGEILEDWEASSESGFTKGDIEHVINEMEEEGS